MTFYRNNDSYNQFDIQKITRMIQAAKELTDDNSLFDNVTLEFIQLSQREISSRLFRLVGLTLVCFSLN